MSGRAVLLFVEEPLDEPPHDDRHREVVLAAPVLEALIQRLGKADGHRAQRSRFARSGVDQCRRRRSPCGSGRRRHGLVMRQRPRIERFAAGQQGSLEQISENRVLIALRQALDRLQ
jgi:hypothetical protein